MKTADGFIIEYQHLSVKLSDGSTFRGKVNIGSEFKRLSDLFKRTPDKFITLVSEENSAQSRIILVNKDCVMWAEVETPAE